MWRQQWPDVCYSGSVNTAGGLLFLGRQDGRIMALDKRNGLKLWDWQLDAPVSAPVATFEYKGEQMLAVYAAGNFYSGSRRGDGVWLMSRKGKMKPRAPLTDAAPANVRGGSAAAVKVDASGGNATAGRVVFQRICALCHGENGKGGHSEGAILPDNIKAVNVMTTRYYRQEGHALLRDDAEAAGDARRRGVCGEIAGEVGQPADQPTPAATRKIHIVAIMPTAHTRRAHAAPAHHIHRQIHQAHGNEHQREHIHPWSMRYMRHQHRRGEQRKGLEPVLLRGVGTRPHAFLLREPLARILVVVVARANLGRQRRDVGQQPRDEYAPERDGHVVSLNDLRRV